MPYHAILLCAKCSLGGLSKYSYIDAVTERSLTGLPEANQSLIGLQLMNKYASYLLNDIVQMTPHLKQIKQYKHGEGFSIAGLTPWN